MTGFTVHIHINSINKALLGRTYEIKLSLLLLLSFLLLLLLETCSYYYAELAE